jgi:hypothetical protein
LVEKGRLGLGRSPLLGLIVGDHETGVDDAGNPTDQCQQNAQDKTEDATGHQNGDGRKDDAEEIAKRFQIEITGQAAISADQ